MSGPLKKSPKSTKSPGSQRNDDTMPASDSSGDDAGADSQRRRGNPTDAPDPSAPASQSQRSVDEANDGTDSSDAGADSQPQRGDSTAAADLSAPASESQSRGEDAKDVSDSSDAGADSQTKHDEPNLGSDPSAPASLGRLETPDLTALADDNGTTRIDERRVDALRLGDVIRAPFDGVVTGVWMQPTGRVVVRVGDDDQAWEADADEVVDVVAPQWRPGEMLAQIPEWSP